MALVNKAAPSSGEIDSPFIKEANITPTANAQIPMGIVHIAIDKLFTAFTKIILAGK
jgi:hypothetical protein